MAYSTLSMGIDEPSNYIGKVTSTPWAEQHWYAAYTRANHEKRVAAELGTRNVEHFLPLYGSVRRWKDRRVKLEFPLFPGYVFVRLALCDGLRVVQIPSVVRLVGFGGQPTALPDDEMQRLRTGLLGVSQAEPCAYLQTGCLVRLKSGPLQGLEGILKKKKTGYRFVVSLKLIQRSIAVEVDAGRSRCSGRRGSKLSKVKVLGEFEFVD
jgi:transcription antitermination factor NusG